jgi:hypothetical protein
MSKGLFTMHKPTFILFASAALLSAEFIVKDAKACPEVDAARPLEFSESPLKLAIPGDAACQGHDEKGGNVRIWRFPHQYQRLAAPKVWKVVVEKGDGDRNSYVLPANSVVGIFFQQMDAEGKWKGYRGSSKNPIALTQPAIVFTLEKNTMKGEGGLKQQYLIWDVLTGDAPGMGEGGTVSTPAGGELRAESVWIWQGLNPIPKKLALGTGKAKIVFQSE